MSTPNPPSARALTDLVPPRLRNRKSAIVGISLLIALGVAASIAGSGGEAISSQKETVSPTPSPATESVIVPDLVGTTGDVAVIALTEAGLIPSWEQSVWSPKNWVVTEQSPAAGGESARGETVRLGVTKIEKTVEPLPPLADTVWAQVTAAFSGEITPSSPLFVVAGVEDVSIGTIRVLAQAELNDDGKETVAQHVFQLGAWSNTELRTVVVRDISGLDTNYYRIDYPHLTQ